MIYKADRKSMLELNNCSRNLQYEMKQFSLGTEFHGGFWATHVYILNNQAEPVCRILDNGVTFMDHSWYDRLTDKEKYIVNEFIEYVKAYI